MRFSDVLAILVGRPTAHEREVDEKLKKAFAAQERSAGELRQVLLNLERARADVHARLRLLVPEETPERESHG